MITAAQHDRIRTIRGLVDLAHRQATRGQDTEVWYALVRARQLIDDTIDRIERAGMAELDGPR